VVDADAMSADLTGGRWGNGRRVRDPDTAQWRWEPVVRYDMRMSRGGGYWVPTPAVRQLRLWAVVSLP
jgi:hypothetical protein